MAKIQEATGTKIALSDAEEEGEETRLKIERKLHVRSGFNKQQMILRGALAESRGLTLEEELEYDAIQEAIETLDVRIRRQAYVSREMNLEAYENVDLMFDMNDVEVDDKANVLIKGEEASVQQIQHLTEMIGLSQEFYLQEQAKAVPVVTTSDGRLAVEAVMDDPANPLRRVVIQPIKTGMLEGAMEKDRELSERINTMLGPEGTLDALREKHADEKGKAEKEYIRNLLLVARTDAGDGSADGITRMYALARAQELIDGMVGSSLETLAGVAPHTLREGDSFALAGNNIIVTEVGRDHMVLHMEDKGPISYPNVQDEMTEEQAKDPGHFVSMAAKDDPATFQGIRVELEKILGKGQVPTDAEGVANAVRGLFLEDPLGKLNKKIEANYNQLADNHKKIITSRASLEASKKLENELADTLVQIEKIVRSGKFKDGTEVNPITGRRIRKKSLQALVKARKKSYQQTKKEIVKLNEQVEKLEHRRDGLQKVRDTLQAEAKGLGGRDAGKPYVTRNITGYLDKFEKLIKEGYYDTDDAPRSVNFKIPIASSSALLRSPARDVHLIPMDRGSLEDKASVKINEETGLVTDYKKTPTKEDFALDVKRAKEAHADATAAEREYFEEHGSYPTGLFNNAQLAEVEQSRRDGDEDMPVRPNSLFKNGITRVQRQEAILSLIHI